MSLGSASSLGFNGEGLTTVNNFHQYGGRKFSRARTAYIQYALWVSSAIFELGYAKFVGPFLFYQH
jgi:hypothetical protein